jgi:hypothetical protein
MEFLFNQKDPYLIFDGIVNEQTPEEYIPLLDTIRKESEWKSLKIPVKKDEFGMLYESFQVKGFWYSFRPMIEIDEIIQKAIETKKKTTSNPKGILSFILLGCDYTDFIYITDDIKLYCEAFKSFIKEDYNNALTNIENALKIKPYKNKEGNIDYIYLFHKIIYELKQKYRFKEILAFYENDIDSLIHTKEIDRLIKILLNDKEFDEALNVISQVRKLISEMSEGRRKSVIYSNQKLEWYQYKKEEFEKLVIKYMKQIEKNK